MLNLCNIRDILHFLNLFRFYFHDITNKFSFVQWNYIRKNANEMDLFGKEKHVQSTQYNFYIYF